MSQPEGKWALDVALHSKAAGATVTIRATRRTKQELSTAWRGAKEMVKRRQLVSAKAYNAETGAVLGEMCQ